MKNEMKLIMENWRRNILNEQDDAQTILNNANQALDNIEKVKDEASRKKLLAGVFTGVTAIAAATFIGPVILTALKPLGVQTTLTSIVASSIKKGGLVAFILNLPKPAQTAILDKLKNTPLDKLKGFARDMVEKLLNIPDGESEKNQLLQALDLPDGMEKLIGEKNFEEIVKKIKERLKDIATSGEDLDRSSLALANTMIRDKFGLTLDDPRIKMN